MSDVDDLLASITGFLSPQAGQARRQWLDGQTNALMYYVPPEVRPQLDAVASMTPAAAYGDSVAASRRMLAEGATPYQRGQAAGDMAAGVLGIVAPGYIAGKAGAPIANALGEMATGYSAPARNALTEFGAAGDARFLASKRARVYTHQTEAEVGGAFNARDGLGSGGLDVEGRPLVARYVAGRQGLGTGDKSFSEEDLAEIVEGQTGSRPKRVPRVSSGRNDAGNLVVNRFTNQPLRVEVRTDVKPDAYRGVLGHEVGHLIDEAVGQIPTKGLSEELEPLYHFGVEGIERNKRLTLPQHLGYKPEEVPREYIAEAIRQYMLAPDALKSKAPKTAERIRKYVNEHPQLRQWVQFNTLAGVALAGAAADQAQAGPATPPRADMGATGRW